MTSKESYKPKLLILCRYSFGYQIDAFYWCKYLCDEFDIHYVCLEDRFDRPVVSLNSVRVTHLSVAKNTFLRGVKYLSHMVSIALRDYDICIVQYFPGCSLLRIFNPKAMINLDIRSGGISDLRLKRWFADNLLRLERLLFMHKSIISKSLERRMRIGSAYIVPLGADIISYNFKLFNEIHLVYVGSLENRGIDKTVKGFSQVYKKYNDKIRFSYTIIGSGSGNEELILKDIVQSEGLSNVVHVIGYVQHAKLKRYFDACNVGVSFIPMTKFYDVQPPTKTFEYLMSGMPVIATATSENKRIVNEVNGVLINDDADAFALGLEDLYRRRNEFNSDTIRQQMSQYTWKSIVNLRLKPYLTELLKMSRA